MLDGFAIADVNRLVRRHQRPRVQGRLRDAAPVGFEPTRGDPIGLAGRRLNHSANVSSHVAYDYGGPFAKRA